MDNYQTITDKNGRTFIRKAKVSNYGANIFIRLTPDMKKRFEELVDKENKTFSSKIRELVEEYIKENE